MMLYLAMSSLGLALVFLGLQILWAWRLARCYPHRETAPTAEDWLPRVAVVLSVRGADPSLIDCLRRLLQQDYPDYEVYIVIDSVNDPAWEILQPLLAEDCAVSVHLRVLEKKYETCSLKVSALTQVIGALDPLYQVVALVDADVIPYATWLRDLVRPFHDVSVGATTGLRWYLPESANWGSLVRSLWNAAAVSQMFAFRIPWGGSLAFRAEVFRDTDLLEQWKQSFCEDTVSYGVLRRLGWQLRFVPAATMINTERIELKDCFFFIRRQLLTARLHHPNWPWVLLAGAGGGLSLMASLAVLIASVVRGDWVAAALPAGALAAFVLGMSAAMMWIENGLRQTARRRGESLPASTWKLALAGPATQIVYLAALISVSFLRTVAWRGITYEIYGATPVRLVAYRPYLSASAPADRTSSLV